MIDPVSREVIRNRLDAIAQEMQYTLLKSAYSIILKEGADGSSAIFSPSGEVIAQATSQPIHLGTFVPAIATVLNKFPIATMKDGDVFCLNDPYQGGTHIPDLIVVVPGFYDERVIVLGVALAHQQDFGGMTPGSMSSMATDHFQEGLIIGPVKLMDAGVENETLVDIIRRNVRTPDQVLGDIHAQVAAGRKVAQRTIELVDELGLETYEHSIVELLDYAERLTRAEIQRIPDGTYVFDDFLDGEPLDSTQRLKIRAEVVVTGSDIIVDFAGTSKQAKGPVNTSPTGVLGPAWFVLRAITDPDIPNNGGCYRPMKIKVPKGTILNPKRPAPVALRAHTLIRVVDVLFGAFAQADPARVPAASNGSLLAVTLGGIDQQTGEPMIYMECNAGGTGGTARTDGVDVLDSGISNSNNIPAEALESSFPVRLLTNKLRIDTGGAGTHRGGLGHERVLEFLGDEAVVSHRNERHRSNPWGLKDGLPGACWRTILERAAGDREEIPARATFVIRKGDRLHMLTGGGGGYGSPLDRVIDAVVDDVRNQKVSPKEALSLYGVSVKADGTVDETSSLKIRKKMDASVGHWLVDRGGSFSADERHNLKVAEEGRNDT